MSVLKYSTKTIIWLLGVSLTLLSAGCKTPSDPREFSDAQLNGMVYDYSGRPVNGVNLTLDETLTGFSDVNGNFKLMGVSRGPHTITASGDKVESVNLTFHFGSRRDILYIRLYSLDNLLDKANDALLNNDFFASDSFLLRAEQIAPDDLPVLYLRSLYLLKIGEAAKALQVMSKLLEKKVYSNPVRQLLLRILSMHDDSDSAYNQIILTNPILLADPKLRDFASGGKTIDENDPNNGES